METLSFTPTREDILASARPVQCTEAGCTCIFASDSHLNMHLARRHGMQHLLQKSDFKKIYHCPVDVCSYHEKMHFKQFKLLKQHYMKVHADKCFLCTTCDKSFSTELTLKAHEEYCGIVFTCSECSMSYVYYESLQTHCRRKKHGLLEKTAYKPNAKVRKSEGKQKLLLPKGSDTYVVLVAADKSSQTDTKPLNSVETQTTGDYFPLKPTTSIETQTNYTQLETKACDTSEKFDLTDYAFAVEQKTSSTQTKDDQLSLMDFDAAFLNCDTETQTDLFSDALLDSCDFYANMYTQTPSCDDMLLDDLEFTDTYTQTALYDDVRSVESQTMLYNNKKKNVLLANRDVVNIETQTDWEQMLKDIE